MRKLVAGFIVLALAAPAIAINNPPVVMDITGEGNFHTARAALVFQQREVGASYTFGRITVIGNRACVPIRAFLGNPAIRGQACVTKARGRYVFRMTSHY